MKLALNGDPNFNLKGVTNEVTLIKKAVERLFKMYGDEEGRIYLRWDTSKRSEAKNDKGDKVFEYPPAAYFAMEYNYRASGRDSGGTNSFRLYNVAVKERNGDVKFAPYKYSFTGNIMLTTRDVELVWWLVFVNPHCAELDDKGCRDYQNITRQDPTYMVFNATEVARKNLRNMEFESEVRYILSTSNETVKVADQKVRSLAHAYYISNAEKMDIDELRIMLINTVINDKSPDAKVKWNELMNNNDHLRNAGIIQRAIDLKVVMVKQSPKARKWHWYNPMTKEFGLPICSIRPNETDVESLKKHYEMNPDMTERLLGEIRAELAAVPVEEKKATPVLVEEDEDE
jgi:hypothetical protein